MGRSAAVMTVAMFAEAIIPRSDKFVVRDNFVLCQRSLGLALVAAVLVTSAKSLCETRS
jgi:hypothetical protein